MRTWMQDLLDDETQAALAAKIGQALWAARSFWLTAGRRPLADRNRPL